MSSPSAASAPSEQVLPSSTTTLTATPTTSSVKTKNRPYIALWDFDSQTVDSWLNSVCSLFQSTGNRKGAKSSPQEQQSTTTTSSSSLSSKLPPELANQAWENLKTAIIQLKAQMQAPEELQDELAEEDEPPLKRQKRANGQKVKKRQIYAVEDPYNIYRHTIHKPEDDYDARMIEDEAARELKTTFGGKLSQMTVSGLVNGMSGRLNGVVQNKKLQPIPGISTDSIPTAKGASLSQLKQLAQILHQSIQTTIEADVLATTPIRIQEMLAPDLSQQEFKAIRKRIYDTVILGKGLSQQEEVDIPTAANTNVHVLEKFKKCPSCGNTEQALFILDRKNGDVICEACGTVNSESLMHEGSQYRKFEGEVDRNHHGDSANPLFSNAQNMSTTLSGVQITTGAGGGGFGTQKRGLETVLRNAHAYTELNISQFGKGDRRTRVGYKDKQKKDAFIQMAHVGDALNLHEAVVQRAKELFAGFRDDRELVQQFKGVVAACLCEAFEQLSSDGRQILKQKQEVSTESFANPRANRRNELHHANLAGKGGLLLDMDAVAKDCEENIEDSAVAKKPISSWNLEDCRVWLMEASHEIAVEWVEDRKKGVKDIPPGSLEELEGRMVEHSITLCDRLETELQENGKKKSANGRGRVITPRVNDMSKLSIKWQHKHERGSGGKGGVGGSGVAVQQNGRSAGQILLLQSAKMLGVMLNDKSAGEAIHKQLRSLVSKQDVRKRQQLREEATRQRFAQMKRKPWLQARAEVDS
ncbi:TFIIB zinc-binding protein [Nitzschia inconspicua]|uniref:General transcription factor TFIIB n=1 Tax=Nitzschia inconspicua TaxID=303405 RepID=A0A9K3KNB5_9STRA|nr:TFIIB zinc-binding protein [Nitzschia inconspicua]